MAVCAYEVTLFIYILFIDVFFMEIYWQLKNYEKNIQVLILLLQYECTMLLLTMT